MWRRWTRWSESQMEMIGLMMMIGGEKGGSLFFWEGGKGGGEVEEILFLRLERHRMDEELL